MRKPAATHTPPPLEARARSRARSPATKGIDLAALRASRLKAPWFHRDARVVARALVGCLLVHEIDAKTVRVAKIVETEAYRGPKDLACHARAGLTARTRSLLGEPAHAYVFLVYGMHDCFNVTSLRAGAGHAVLVRAAEPVAGLEPGSLRGPGRFARAMGITRAMDGWGLTEPPLYICPHQTRPRIGVSARVGVAYAGEWADAPWRFFDSGSREVSRPPKTAIGRGSGA
jgi:DNA-3-methyladenine glycosylase